MVPAIMILSFAWTLKAMTDSLGADVYVATVVASSARSLLNFLPAIIFVVGCFLAFATGTSWGTFGILIPIVVAVFQNTDPQLMIISISACMAGAVCGDHCSPISDTTIMASAGAQCEHVTHVTTQLPYVITVAAVSFVTYLIAGFVRNALIMLVIGFALMVATLYVIKQIAGNKQTGALSVDSNGFHRQHASFIFYLFLSRMWTHCPHVSAPCHSLAHHPRTQSTAHQRA